jgi:hypothetical protein
MAARAFLIPDVRRLPDQARIRHPSIIVIQGRDRSRAGARAAGRARVRPADSSNDFTNRNWRREATMVSRQSIARRKRYAEDLEYREKRIASSRARHAAHKDDINARDRARYAKHKDEINAQAGKMAKRSGFSGERPRQ